MPTFYTGESRILDQHAAKKNSSGDKSTSFEIQLESATSLNWGLKKGFYDKLNLSTIFKTLEAVKILASTNGVSTIAIPKLGCGLDQINWQEVVKLIHDIFA